MFSSKIRLESKSCHWFLRKSLVGKNFRKEELSKMTFIFLHFSTYQLTFVMLFSSQYALSSMSSFIRGRSWLVNNPHGKLPNQSDRSSYFTHMPVQNFSFGSWRWKKNISGKETDKFLEELFLWQLLASLPVTWCKK